MCLDTFGDILKVETTGASEETAVAYYDRNLHKGRGLLVHIHRTITRFRIKPFILLRRESCRERCNVK